jgi:Ca2+-binding EF-hand superfamily protein
MRAFSSVDSAREGAVNFGSLLNFCRLNGYYASESEVIAMVRRLDVDADQRISYDEFCLTFAHQEPLSLL